MLFHCYETLIIVVTTRTSREIYFGLPRSLEHLSTLENSIKLKTSVLVHWGKGV